jgi:hypothetical protein
MIPRGQFGETLNRFGGSQCQIRLAAAQKKTSIFNGVSTVSVPGSTVFDIRCCPTRLIVALARIDFGTGIFDNFFNVLYLF